MHRIATEAGKLDLERKLESIRQSPAEIVFVSSADTELAALARIWGPKFGTRLRLMNASSLQHPDAAEHYADHVLVHAKIAIFRLHGGKAYFPKLLDEFGAAQLDYLQTFQIRGVRQDDVRHVVGFVRCIGESYGKGEFRYSFSYFRCIPGRDCRIGFITEPEIGLSRFGPIFRRLFLKQPG